MIPEETMPFDGLRLAWLPEDMTAALAASGLRPVDPVLLEHHKAEQVRQHPASWVYRHSGAVLAAQGAMLLLAAGAFCALSSFGHPEWATSLGLLAVALMMMPLMMRVRGPARWQERRLDGLEEVHPMVRARAAQLSRQLPEATYAIGELIQDRVTLDPYLVAEHRGKRVILGIWDGGSLIA